MIWRDSTYEYEWLWERVGNWQTWLDDNEVRPGTVVSVEGDYSPSTTALVLALINRGAVIVPISVATAQRAEDFRTTAEVEVSIGFDPMENVTVLRSDRTPTNLLTCRLVESGEAGLVLFTSGSTGGSKAVLHSFDRIIDKFKTPRHSFITLTFLLLDHIGGINTLFYSLANGGTGVVLTSRDPDQVCRAIELHRVELLPTSPTFLNLLLISEAYNRYDLSSLKRVTYGTEVMPSSTLERMREILPSVEFQQTYGLSEVGILHSKSQSKGSLWVRVGGEGFETKIQGGTLWIRAESAMLGYLNAPSPYDEDGWLDTGDAVDVDGDYVRFLGRKSDVINVGGMKVYPGEVEDQLLRIPNIRDAIVLGEANAITGQIVVARVSLNEVEDIVALRKRIRNACRETMASYKIPAKIEIVSNDQYSERFKKVRSGGRDNE